jgi:hypothetical protein
MESMKRRRRLATMASVGAAGLTAALTLGQTMVASAATVGDGAPRWRLPTVEQIRDEGSDTTFFMLQKISDLYEQAGLYGCALQSDDDTCNLSGDQATTDSVDNYSKVEITTGLDNIGSGAGQNQLCGTNPTPFPVDFARSSKKPSTSISGCTDMVGMGFAKDGVPGLAFPQVNPGAYGAIPSSSPLFSAVDTTANLNANGGQALMGPVAAGWLPGDPVNGPYSGTALANITNNDNGGGTGSVAYRIYCATDTTRISDWGQLTNLSGGKTVGNGTPIGIPIDVVGVNPASGTVATWTAFVQGTAPSCSPSVNSWNAPGNGNKPWVALENNTAQLSDFAKADYADQPDQAAELAQMLYYESNGVYNTNQFAHSVTLGSNSYIAQKLSENGSNPTTPNLLNNTYPTARTLYNIYRTSTVRASTAGFLNWMCDSNTAFTKATDLNTGKNYDAEITGLINTSFGFIRLTTTTAAPNNSCQLITSVANANS